MATFTKSRARKPLAEGDLLRSATRAAGRTITFSFDVHTRDPVTDKGTYHSLHLDRGEAIAAAAYIAQNLTRDFDDYRPDSRGPAEQLRALADLIAAGK